MTSEGRNPHKALGVVVRVWSTLGKIGQRKRWWPGWGGGHQLVNAPPPRRCDPGVSVAPPALSCPPWALCPLTGSTRDAWMKGVSEEMAARLALGGRELHCPLSPRASGKGGAAVLMGSWGLGEGTPPARAPPSMDVGPSL